MRHTAWEVTITTSLSEITSHQGTHETSRSCDPPDTSAICYLLHSVEKFLIWANCANGTHVTRCIVIVDDVYAERYSLFVLANMDGVAELSRHLPLEIKAVGHISLPFLLPVKSPCREYSVVPRRLILVYRRGFQNLVTGSCSISCTINTKFL